MKKLFPNCFVKTCKCRLRESNEKCRDEVNLEKGGYFVRANPVFCKV